MKNRNLRVAIGLLVALTFAASANAQGITFELWALSTQDVPSLFGPLDTCEFPVCVYEDFVSGPTNIDWRGYLTPFDPTSFDSGLVDVTGFAAARARMEVEPEIGNMGSAFSVLDGDIPVIGVVSLPSSGIMTFVGLSFLTLRRR